MKKPYVICHMMTSVGGRIDCAMTEQLLGVQQCGSGAVWLCHVVNQ